MLLSFKPLFLSIVSCFIFSTLLIPFVFATETANPPSLDRYQQALNVDPDNPTLLYILGLAQLKSGKAEDAIKSLRTAYPTYTRSIEMQLNLAEAFLQTGDTDSALLYLEQAEALGATKIQNRYALINAYYKVGLIYREQEALNEAGTLFRRVLILDPDRVEIYRLLGDIAAKTGQSDEAITLFSKYLEHYPDDQSTLEYIFSLYFNDATRLMEKGDYTSAQRAFLSAQNYAPENPLIHYYLGFIAYRSNETETAISHFISAYSNIPEELKENTRSMLYNSILQARDTQQMDLALVGITPLIAPSNARSKDLMLAGTIYLQRNEFQAAREIFKHLLKRDPTDPQATINLVIAEENAVDELFQEGLVAYKTRQYLNAIDHFDQVLSIQPEEQRSAGYRKKALKKLESETTALFKKAKINIINKDYLDAMTLINKGLALTPNNTSGLRLKREALQALQKDVDKLIENGFELLRHADFTAAEAHFNKALLIDPGNPKASQGVGQSEQQRLTKTKAEISQGNAALDEGDLKMANGHFTAAEKLTPELPEAIEGRVRFDAIISSLLAQELQLGRSAHSAGNLTQAERHFNNALRFKNSPEIRSERDSIISARTDHDEGLLQQAHIARQNKEFKTALSIYNRILSHNPEHPANIELGELKAEISVALASRLDQARQFSEQGDDKTAVSLYRQALDLEPTNKEALQGVKNGRKLIEAELDTQLQGGRSAFNSGKLKAAADAFNKVLQIDPYHAEAKAALSKITNIEQTGIRPGDENILYLQGIEFYTSGQYRDAIQSWEKVLQLTPDNVRAKMNIEKAKRKLQSIREFKSG